MANVDTGSAATVQIKVSETEDECSTNNGINQDFNKPEERKDDLTKKTENASGRESSFRSFLRPSALSGDIFKSSFSSVPSNNPVTPKSSSSSSTNKFASTDESTESLFQMSPKPDKVDVKTPLSAPAIPAPVSLSNPNYVFGQNIGERVVESVESVSNGTTNMLFTSAIKAGNQEPKESDENNKESSSLLEDAARCQEQRAVKRKYEEVQVTTGEEDEKNVLQTTVKLFAFEAGSWVERGRGTLRLNDLSCGGSRIVIRTLGSLRVVLNTKIWANMELSRANDRSIRTTAMDSAGTLKIFLIQGCPTDITTLYNCMDGRVRQCKLADSETVDPYSDEKTRGEANKDDNPPSSKIPILDQS